jgi:hypothetical protein
MEREEDLDIRDILDLDEIKNFIETHATGPYKQTDEYKNLMNIEDIDYILNDPLQCKILKKYLNKVKADIRRYARERALDQDDYVHYIEFANETLYYLEHICPNNPNPSGGKRRRRRTKSVKKQGTKKKRTNKKTKKRKRY